MSTLIIKPADRQSIDFAETERVKSTSLGAVVHSTDLNNYAKKDLSNVGYPAIVYTPNDPNGNIFDGLHHTGSGDRVVENFISSDGKTWYRKWASGWKECGGIFTCPSGNNPTAQKYFPESFTFCPISIVVSCAKWYDSSYACQIAITEKTKEYFKTRIAGTDIKDFYWQASGY